MEPPETRYAKAGDAHIAYQVIGDGPVDLVWVGTWWGHVEARWDVPEAVRYLERLCRFTRVILFDKRGIGLSDPVPLTSLPTLEGWMDDIRAVMDAEDWERAAILAFAEAGPLGALFAATYPKRTTALVLSNGFARLLHAPDYPHGLSDDFKDAYVDLIDTHWGTDAYVEFIAPSADQQFRKAYGRFMRQAASPGTASAMVRMILGQDVRDVLPIIHVPTLVLGSPNGILPVEMGRYLADHIPDAKFVGLRPQESIPYLGDIEESIGEIEEFLTGVRSPPAHERVLATVMFTDLVDSTARAAELGDGAWRVLLERHDDAVRRELTRCRGVEVKSMGDGFLATFDGPARAISCARAIGERLRAFDLQVRAGLHTGECELQGDDVRGIAVHIAARIASRAQAGEVLVSSTVKDLVAGSGIKFDDRGMHALKGIPDEWRLFAVKS